MTRLAKVQLPPGVRHTVYCVLALSGLLLAGCRGDPFHYNYTRIKPSEADLVGIWVPDEHTIKDMRDRGGYDLSNSKTKLVLRSDGTFEMLDMPDWWKSGLGESNKGFYSSSGTWKVSQHSPETWWELDLWFATWAKSLYLRGEKPPYLIHMIIGDPDRGKAMILVRQNEQGR